MKIKIMQLGEIGRGKKVKWIIDDYEAANEQDDKISYELIIIEEGLVNFYVESSIFVGTIPIENVDIEASCERFKELLELKNGNMPRNSEEDLGVLSKEEWEGTGTLLVCSRCGKRKKCHFAVNPYYAELGGTPEQLKPKWMCYDCYWISMRGI